MARLMRILVTAALLTGTIVSWGAPKGALAQDLPGPFVQQAFDLLLDRSIESLSSGTLLAGGWEDALRTRMDAGIAISPGESPRFAGSREEDWTSFLGAYPQLVESTSGQIDQVELDRAIVRGMAMAAQSRSTSYSPPGAAGSSIAGRTYGGIGVEIAPGFVVREVFNASPAAEDGMRTGDIILAVDKKPVAGETFAVVRDWIRGPVGSIVEIQVKRPGLSEALSIQIARAEITVNWLEHRVLDGNVGYLRLRSFPEREAMGAFTSALVEFQRAGVVGLIIDLRGTGCCFLDSVHEAARQLVGSGPVIQQVNKAGQVRTVSASGGFWGREIPYAVLVDASTESNGELLATALQELSGARIVGTRTGGYTISATRFPLDDGSTLVVPTSTIRSGRGATLHGVGIEPEVVIPLDAQGLAAGRDNQIETALLVLRP